MGNRLGYAQTDISGDGNSTGDTGAVEDVASPLIEDIPDVNEETPEQTLDDIITMIVTKYETVISSGQLLDGNLATIPQLKKRNQQLQGTLAKIIQILKEKQTASKNMLKHNEALQHQVESLKDVISITRDLLNIRNAEVEHLHEDMQNLQDKISVERKRQSEVTEKMETASKLNDSLKAEYQKQMDLFSKLRLKYEERQEALARENTLLQKQLDIAKNIVNSSHSTESSAPPSSPYIIPLSGNRSPFIENNNNTSHENGTTHEEDTVHGPQARDTNSTVSANQTQVKGTNSTVSANQRTLNEEVEEESEEDEEETVSVVLKSVDNVLQLETSLDQDTLNVEDSD